MAKATFILRNVLSREDSWDVICGQQESPFDPSHKNAAEFRIPPLHKLASSGELWAWLSVQVPAFSSPEGLLPHFESLLEAAGVGMVNP